MEIVILLLFSILVSIHTFQVVKNAIHIKKYSFKESYEKPSVSVVVCAHNEASNLSELIPILLDQAYQDYEIIIVLDRCSDTSLEYIEGINSDKLSHIIISEKNSFQPKKFGLTIGIIAAKGDWVLLTDADCRPEKEWISEMSKGMKSSNEIVLGLSPYKKVPSFLNLIIQYETFQTAFHFVASMATGQPYMALGRNLAYRKKLFIDNNGFGDTAVITGGDDDLFIQSVIKPDNALLVLTEKSHVESIPKSSWSNYIRQKTRHFSVGSHYPKWVIKKEILRWVVHSLLWLFALIAIYTNPFFGTSILTVALVIKGISINIVSKRLGKRFNNLWLPLVDLIYVVVFPLISIRSLFVKNVTWK